MKPRVFQHRSGFQLSYDLPHNVYDAHVYPRKSVNGSTVIVYSHEDGLRVVWYAGKQFKKPQSDGVKVNGRPSQPTDVIDLDSDDEETPVKPAEFEEEEEDIDLTSPFHKVLRYIDIPLGVAALNIAVPPLPQELPDETPGLLKDNIVVVAGCTDFALRTVFVPLQPPPPNVYDLGKLGVQITKHFGHQDLISAVAITYSSDLGGDVEEENDESSSQLWSLLLASTSCTGSGMLLVHQVQISNKALPSPQLSNFRLIRRVHMCTSLNMVKLAFNTASHQADRHSNLLITLPGAGIVKVYQVFARSSPKRRGSAATMDSVSTTRSTQGPVVSGKFLITLHPDEGRPLDSQWICGGRAIIVVLGNGRFGIWDLEAAGLPTDTVLKNQSNVVGISGGAITKFAASGTLDRKRDDNGSFTLFEDAAIIVRPAAVEINDDAIMLTAVAHGTVEHDTPNATVSRYVSSVSSWWKSKGNSKGSLQPSDRLTGLPSLTRANAQLKGTGLLGSFSHQSQALGAAAVANFMVATPSQLLLFVAPLVRGGESEITSKPESIEQSLLARGNLDLDGVDRYLDDMQRSRPHSRQTSQVHRSAKPNFGSSFQSHDVEMELDSPLPVKAPNFTSASKASIQPARRNFT